MRKTLLVGAVALLLGLGCVEELPACGDKFLVVSRGTRFQRAPLARKPASILIYSGLLGQPQGRGAGIEEVLRKNGYRPTTVATAAEFDRALSQGGWDLVVVGIADASAARRRLPQRSSLMPVVANPSEEEWKRSRQEYPVVLKAPAKGPAVLDAVDQALAAQRKTHSKAAYPSI